MLHYITYTHIYIYYLNFTHGNAIINLGYRSKYSQIQFPIVDVGIVSHVPSFLHLNTIESSVSSSEFPLLIAVID